ncbi:MAG: DUF1648 domain-containing protein [Arachnia sp.]
MLARSIFWISALAGVFVVAASWFVLPDRVPLHFGVSGAVQWGSRTQSVVFFASMVAGVALLFWVLAVAMPRVPETVLNIPERDKAWWLATPERRDTLINMVVADLYAMGTATIVFLVSLQAMIIREARRSEPGLGPFFWVVFGIYMTVVLGYSLSAVAVRYRAPRP